MYGDCYDSHIQVIKSFMQYQHSSVQLVQEKMGRNAKFLNTSDVVEVGWEKYFMSFARY